MRHSELYPERSSCFNLPADNFGVAKEEVLSFGPSNVQLNQFIVVERAVAQIVQVCANKTELRCKDVVRR